MAQLSQRLFLKCKKVLLLALRNICKISLKRKYNLIACFCCKIELMVFGRWLDTHKIYPGIACLLNCGFNSLSFEVPSHSYDLMRKGSEMLWNLAACHTWQLLILTGYKFHVVLSSRHHWCWIFPLNVDLLATVVIIVEVKPDSTSTTFVNWLPIE